MKKIFFLMMSLLILSCGARKKEQLEREKKIEWTFDYWNYIVHYPDNWAYNFDHYTVVYKPKGFHGSGKLCRLQIFKSDEPIINALIQNVDWRTSENEEKIKSPQKVETKFGVADLYVIKYSYYWRPEPREVTTTLIRFKHNSQTYNLRYTAEKEYFDMYKKDIEYFMENLEFKE